MKGKLCFSSFAYLICTYVLFLSGKVFYPSYSSRFFFVIVSLLCAGMIWFPPVLVKTEKYRQTKYIIPISIICIYASLATFGYQVLSLSEARMQLDLTRAIYLLIGAVWFFYFIFTVLYLMEFCSDAVACTKTNTQKRKYAYLILFSLLSVIQVILAISFLPGGFPNDTVWLMQEAAGDSVLNDWHPVFYALTMRFLLWIVPHESVFLFVQMILFAWLVTDFLMIGFDRGISLRTLLVAGTAFLLLPNQVFSGIGIVKDYPFTLALLWGTLLLVKLSLNPGLYRNKFFLIQLFIDQFFILAYRHNGIIPAIFMAAAFLIVGFRSKKLNKMILLLPAVLALLVFSFFKGPGFDMLKVYRNTSSPYVTMICAVGSVVNQDLPLSDEANAILEEVMPLEDWGTYYSRFEGHDRYVWGRGSESFNTSSITLTKAFRIYFESLFKYPDVVFKDRLDGMNILWCVAQPPDCFNTRYFDSVYRFDFTENYINVENLESEESKWVGYINRSAIAEFYRQFSGDDPEGTWDLILWRGGIYVILLLICSVFWSGNNMKHMVLPFVPLLGNLFASVLLVYHQSFRYIYFVQLLTIALIFISILTKNDSKKNV